MKDAQEHIKRPVKKKLDAFRPTGLTRFLPLGLTLLMPLIWVLLDLALQRPARESVVSGVGFAALGVGLCLAIAVTLSATLTLPGRQPSPGPGRRRRLAFLRAAALPGLSFLVALPAISDSSWATLPSLIASLVVAAGAAWILRATLRALLVSLGLGGTARVHHNVHASAAAYLAAHSSSNLLFQPVRFGAASGLTCAIDHLVLTFGPHVCSLQAGEGSLPTANEERLRGEIAASLRIAVDERSVSLGGGTPSERGEALALAVDAWSQRARSSRDVVEFEDGESRPLSLSSIPSQGWRVWVRPALAAAAAITTLALLTVSLVVFPVWEGSILLRVLLIALAVIAALLHSVPTVVDDPRRIEGAGLAAAANEVHELLWALGIPARDEVEVQDAAQGARHVILDGPGIRCRLDVWPIAVTPAGTIHGERLMISTPSDGPADRLADWLTDNGLPFLDLSVLPHKEQTSETKPSDRSDANTDTETDTETETDAETKTDADTESDFPWSSDHSSARAHSDVEARRPGERTLVLGCRRVVGSGRGAWRDLAWQMEDEAGLLTNAALPSLVWPLRLSPPKTRSQVSRRRFGVRYLVACLAVSLVSLALPAVGPDQYPEASTGNAESERLAQQCPDAGTTDYHALSALRCVANAAGQGDRPLDRLDWTSFLEPVAVSLEGLSYVGFVSSVDDCDAVGATWRELTRTHQLRLATAILERHRGELWKQLRFYWPDRVLRQGRGVDWDKVSDALGACVGTIESEAIDDVRRFYRLTGATFESLVRPEDE